jgi:hypothetical protein
MRILSKKMKRANTYAQYGRNRKLLSKVEEFKKEIEFYDK